MNIVKLHRGDRCRILSDTEVSLTFSVSGGNTLKLYTDDIIYISAVREYWYKIKLVSGRGYDEFRVVNTRYYSDRVSELIAYFNGILSSAPETSCNVLATDDPSIPYAYFDKNQKLVYPSHLSPVDMIKYSSFQYLDSRIGEYNSIDLARKNMERNEKKSERIKKRLMPSRNVLFYIQDKEFSEIDLAILS